MSESPFRTDAYVAGKDLNLTSRNVVRVLLDRVRAAGHNPRKGRVSMYFEDAGVGASWIENED